MRLSRKLHWTAVGWVKPTERASHRWVSPTLQDYKTELDPSGSESKLWAGLDDAISRTRVDRDDRSAGSA